MLNASSSSSLLDCSGYCMQIRPSTLAPVGTWLFICRNSLKGGWGVAQSAVRFRRSLCVPWRVGIVHMLRVQGFSPALAIKDLSLQRLRVSTKGPVWGQRLLRMGCVLWLIRIAKPAIGQNTASGLAEKSVRLPRRISPWNYHSSIEVSRRVLIAC